MSAVLAGSDPVTRSTDTSPTTSGGRSPQEAQRWRRVKVTLLVLAGLCVAACAAYLVWNVRGNWSYALSLRSRQLGALVVVGVAVGVSSLVFQTVSGSRILTPGVMGFDALYSFIQTVIVFTLGAGRCNSSGSSSSSCSMRCCCRPSGCCSSGGCSGRTAATSSCSCWSGSSSAGSSRH